jgi:pimeloyl-ACP methyl ester carboxylesterase
LARFALIHGGWHGPWVWDKITPLLIAHGHEVVTPEIRVDEPGTWVEDGEKLDAELRDRIAETVLVGHSSGGRWAALVAAKRTPKLVVYIAPATPLAKIPEGMPDRVKPGVDEAVAYDDQDRDYLPEEAAVGWFYGRLDEETARWAAARLLHDTDRGSDFPLESVPDVPSAYIYGTEDEIFTSEGMEWSARHIFGVEPIAIPTGHTPQLEAPELVANLLCELAESRRGLGLSGP